MDVVAEGLIVMGLIAIFLNAKNGTLGTWARSKFLGLAPGQTPAIGIPFAIPGKANPEGPPDATDVAPDAPAEPAVPKGPLDFPEVPDIVPAIFTTASYRAGSV